MRFWILIFLLPLLACEISKQTEKSTFEDSAKASTDTVITTDTLGDSKMPPLKNKWFDGVASLLAGQNSKGYTAIRDSIFWQAYAKSMDSTWNYVNEKRLSPMSMWAKEEYGNKAKENDTLFYPFSGPDFLNAFTLFPQTKTYFLFALEPIGTLPDLAHKTYFKQKAYFENLVLALNDIYTKSYFITKRMNVQLGGEVYGTLPLIAVFMKQTGHLISDIKAIKLDSAGTLLEFPYDSLENNNKRPRGVKIEFYKNGDTTLRNFYYFSADLGDGGLTSKRRLNKFLNTFRSFNSYAKSASYLMHYEEFSIIRNHILQKSKLHLQDDTGIAFRFINTAEWDVQLYGQYVTPVKDFSKYLFQKDLLAAYRRDSSSIKDLPFELGYHWGSKKNNLMLLLRK